MAARKQPTNSDIYRTLGQIDEKVDSIHKQVRATNGRVTELERWKSELDVIEVYKEKNPEVSKHTQEYGWTNREKFLTSVILSLLAILGALVGTGKI